MFFDEPTAAFAAIRRHLVAGGRFVFACWQGVERNPWHLGTALRKLLPPPTVPAPGKSPVGPFALGDDEYVRELLEAAGYAGGPTARRTRRRSVRRPAPWSIRSLFGFMGVPPEREDEALGDRRTPPRPLRRCRRRVKATGIYDYPLAFIVYEATTP